MEACIKVTEHSVTNTRDITQECLGPAPRGHGVYSTASSSTLEKRK